MNKLITWVESVSTKKICGYTNEDLTNEQRPKYYIEHNTHLHIEGFAQQSIYLASTEDAKQCAELIEKGCA